MNKELKNFLENGYTPFQVCALAEKKMKAHGFKRVNKGKLPTVKNGSKYYLYDGGTFVAFTVNGTNGLTVAASHTDSPVLKVKGLPQESSPKKLNCEVYGGALNYTFFDIPLKIAGRIYADEGGGITAHNAVSPYTLVIPSLAVHQQRDVNGNFGPSVQTDLSPLIGGGDFLQPFGIDNITDFDLYACPALSPYESGVNGEYLCSPRIDNLTSAFASLDALADASGKGICVAVCFNSEETGSRTRTAAGGVFLLELLKEICAKAGCEFDGIRDNSFMLSVDNAHATHPSHPEKSDPVNKVTLGGGIVIKHHTNYATDALNSSVAKKIFAAKGIATQDFYCHSDLPCGGTIGLIAAANTGIRACDIGIAQLAMHSSSETCAQDDVIKMTDALKAFFESNISFDADSGAKIE